MHITVISDTHGKHRELHLPGGEMLLHAGDISSVGQVGEVRDFLDWFADLDYRHKIFIAGNHDFFFEKENPALIADMIPEDVIYLNDSGTEIEGLKIWGSPVTPWFYNWAFNRRRGAEIRKHHNLIPADTDILLTHGPAFEILDETTGMQQAGCVDLRERIAAVRPRLHACGHIHEAYGEKILDGIHYMNASVLDERYRLVNAPLTVEL